MSIVNLDPQPPYIPLAVTRDSLHAMLDKAMTEEQAGK